MMVGSYIYNGPPEMTLVLDLIPLKQFLDRHSPLLKVYIHGYCVCAATASHLPNIDISEGHGSLGTKAQVHYISQLADYCRRRCGIISLLYFNVGW
jgi:hypothetical protein